MEEFQPSLRFVLCACSCLSAKYCCKAPYWWFCSAQWYIKWIFGKLNSASNYLAISISWLKWSHQEFIRRAASWTASKFQHYFPRVPLVSSWVLFSGHWLWLSHFCWLAQVKKHLWWCENEASHPPCSSMLHHRVTYIDHTYWIQIMPVCTQLCDWVWDADRGFRLIETGLQLQECTSSFPSSPSHSIEKLPHMTYFLVWGRGKQAWITRLHCTCRTIRATSWSGKSTSGGGQACWSGLYGGGQA